MNILDDTIWMLEKAKKISTEVHMNQKDLVGKPYLQHIQRVMNRCENDKERIVAVLHDVIEDSNGTWSRFRLTEEGFTQEIVDAVDNITKRSGEHYQAYLERVMSSKLSAQIKMYDLEDNMDIRRLTTISDIDVTRLRKYLNAYHQIKACLTR